MIGQTQQTIDSVLPRAQQRSLLVSTGNSLSRRRCNCPPACSGEPLSRGMAVFRALRRRDHRHHHGTDSAGSGGAHRCRPGCGARPRRRHTRRIGSLGAQRIRQHHGLADFRSLHVRARLRADRPRQANRAAAHSRAGIEDAGARLRHHARRPAARAVHPVDHRASRRHHLPGHPQHPGTVWVARTRPERAEDRLVPPVHRHLDDAGDREHVHHGACAERAGDWVHRRGHGTADLLVGLVPRIRAGGVRPARDRSARSSIASILRKSRKRRRRRGGRPRS